MERRLGGGDCGLGSAVHPVVPASHRTLIVFIRVRLLWRRWARGY